MREEQSDGATEPGEDARAGAMAMLRGVAAAREGSFQGYVHALAHGRFVLRRVMQILDGLPREYGLEPLNHQALLQIYGADTDMTIGNVADRLGIAPAFGSRLVSQLEKGGLVERKPHPTDRRASIVAVSAAGVERLRVIDREIYRKIRVFQDDLSEEGKYSALLVFAAYVGLDGDAIVADRLSDSTRWARRFR